MCGYSITPRDRVWAAIFKQQGQGPVQVADIREAIVGERPSDETIHRVLKSASELGVIDHQPASPYYQVKARHTDGVRPARERRKSVFPLIDALNLEGDESNVPDPSDELLQIVEERKEKLISLFEEGDDEIDIKDIISEVRAAQLAQSGQLDNQVIEEMFGRGSGRSRPRQEPLKGTPKSRSSLMRS